MRRIAKIALWLALGLSAMWVQAAEREGAFDSYRFMFDKRQANARKSKTKARKAAPGAPARRKGHTPQHGA